MYKNNSLYQIISTDLLSRMTCTNKTNHHLAIEDDGKPDDPVMKILNEEEWVKINQVGPVEMIVTRSGR